MKTKISIHRALSELKLLDDQITKKIEGLQPIALKQRDSLRNNSMSEEAFKDKASSDYDSILGLIARRREIKAAIIKSNAETVIKVGDESMTVAEAIHRKSEKDFTEKLIGSMEKSWKKASAEYNNENDHLAGIALNNALVMLGKEGQAGVKPTDEDVKNITEPFIERNKIHLVDPLGLESKIGGLKTAYDTFMSNVDACLSESNATTFIEV